MQIAQTTQAVMRLDWAEVRRSRWLYLFLLLNALLAGVFIFAGMRESALLGFTGMSRVMSSIAHALLLLLPLLALMLSGQVVTRGRDDGSLELLFGHPLPRSKYFAAISVVRYAVLVVPVACLMAFLAITGWAVFGEPFPGSALLRETGICAALLWAFTGLGLWVSVSVRSQSKALIALILIWLAGVVLIDFGLIGLMLEWGLDARAVFLLATLNPVEAARMALLSAAEPTLGNLGPVGLYLVSRIGAGWLFVVGCLWPLLVGCGSWAYARREFLAQDLI